MNLAHVISNDMDEQLDAMKYAFLPDIDIDYHDSSANILSSDMLERFTSPKRHDVPDIDIDFDPSPVLPSSFRGFQPGELYDARILMPDNQRR